MLFEPNIQTISLTPTLDSSDASSVLTAMTVVEVSGFSCVSLVKLLMMGSVVSGSTSPTDSSWALDRAVSRDALSGHEMAENKKVFQATRRTYNGSDSGKF